VAPEPRQPETREWLSAVRQRVRRPEEPVDPAASVQEEARGTVAVVVEASDGPLLEGTDLSRTYAGSQGVTALRGVSLRASSGDFVALLGPSGSGKSTLLGLLAGLDEPETGEVRWRGRSVSALLPEEVLDLRRRRMGIVFQSFGLLPILSALENVALPLRVAGVRPTVANDRATEWLERLGLADRFDNRVFELSAGQQQRVAVARSLVTDPEIVLADEPIAEVDSENAVLILHALSAVSDRGGAVVCATHNPAALGFATRAVLLRDGLVEAEGAPGDVLPGLSTD
jgi:putative ABC transport system ATP-binding protein